MGSSIYYIKELCSRLKSAWFGADVRALAIFRITFGFVVFCDIARRLPYINVFYSKLGLIDLAVPPSKYAVKSFSLLSSFTGPTEVTVFFYIALISAFFFIIGYRTKLFHFVTLVMVLSIHNRVTDIANGGDIVLINFLIWTIFLPLGASLSIDSIRKRLSMPDPGSPEGLNNRPPSTNNTIYDLAYFVCLLQLAVIYLYNFLNKDGQRWFFHDHDPTNNWADGSGVYFMYQLDAFLTPIGNFIQDNIISIPISSFLGASVMLLEASAPVLILLPFYMKLSRRLLLACLVLFHLSIGMSVSIGLFAWVMIAIFPILLRPDDIKMLKGWVKKISRGPITVFYDTDCGFCHQTARVLRSLDSLSNISWAGESSDIEKPPGYEGIKDQSIVVYERSSGRVWHRHKAFGRIMLSIPFGFLVSWIFFIPGLELLFGKLYDLIARNRTHISSFLGLRACGLGSKDVALETGFKKSGSMLAKVFDRIKLAVSSSAIIILVYVSSMGALSSNPFNDDLLQDRIYVDVKSYLVNELGISGPSVNRKTRLNEILSASEKSELFRYMSDRYGKKQKSLSNVQNVDKLTERLNNNFKHTKFTRNVSRYLRMSQAWNMFSPDVREYDTWLLVEAELDDGSKIDLFTGKESKIYIQGKRRSDSVISLDYELDYGPRKQFWRKYFHRLNKGETDDIDRLFRWVDQGSVLRGTSKKIHGFFKIPEGKKIQNVRLFKLSDYNSKPDSGSKRKNGAIEFKKDSSSGSKGPKSRKNPSTVRKK